VIGVIFSILLYNHVFVVKSKGSLWWARKPWCPDDYYHIAYFPFFCFTNLL